MTVSGDANRIEVKNILVGEVWLCSGQSNMDFPIARVKGWRTGIVNQVEVLADADYPQLRLFHVQQVLSPAFEQDDCGGEWVLADSTAVKDFSAVAFLFGRKLHQELRQPVGIIQSSWGGTHAESWTKRADIDADEVNRPLLAEQAKAWRDYVADTARYNAAKVAHAEKMPPKPKDPNHCKSISTLWNGMIAPLAPYTLKGVIWYQGESNAIRHQDYTRVFGNMMASWRREFKNPDLPFYFVQIAPHYKQPPEIRDAQLRAWQQTPNTGMAVITDAGDSTDIHPRNKQIPAERLAAWALAKQYGRDVPYSGPLYRSMKIEGSKAILSFDYLFGGLAAYSKRNPLRGFEIAGADGVYYPADASVKGDNVIVSSPDVKQPLYVRYGWGTFFRSNLTNKAGLPASPFKTCATTRDDARTTARRFADSEMQRWPEAWQTDYGKRLYFGYSQGVECLAMLRLWRQTGDDSYFRYVEQWADTLINDRGQILLYEPQACNIDFINSGKVLFDVYAVTNNPKYRMAMDSLANQMTYHPRTSEGAFWHKKVYPNQVWLDGLYMGAPFLAQYGATFGKPEWLDDAAKQFRVCAAHNFDPATGLYYHAWDESRSQAWANPLTGQSPNFWGRSIGWWMMAMVDALDYLPADHPDRPFIVDTFKNLAAVLPAYQDADGLWWQVIDKPGAEGNYPEASVSAMLMYALAKGSNRGYLAVGSRLAAERAYHGITSKLLRENPDGSLSLTNCCAVAGLGGKPYRDGSYDYYIHEAVRDNDAKAVGPFISGCLELAK
jgi:unsaturated rhamnogalacturonyl hydrolase